MPPKARELLEKLHQAEKNYKTTIDSMVDAIHLIDRGYHVLLMNRAFRDWMHLLDIEGQPVVGRNLFEVFPFLPDAVRDEYKQVFETGELLITEETTPLEGREFITETRKIPVFEKNRVTRVITVVRDITRERRVEQEILRTQKLESLGLLAGGIAHDFNNLLTGIKGNLNLAKLNASNPEIIEFLEAGEKGINRAQELTRQLLIFARGGTPVPESGSVRAIVEESTQLVLHGSPVRGEFQIAPDLWRVALGESELNQVIQNIIINAKQAMPSGGTITISAKNVRVGESERIPLSPGPFVILSIQDEGIGIPKESLTRIFDPYFTTKQKGSGLGLSIVFSIVKKHEGHVTVQSKVGEGSTFELWLPASIEGQGDEVKVKKGPI